MSHADPALIFTQEEIDLIGRTADALSAYMGKPVLAEIMDADDTGAEWVAFGIPLGMGDEIDEESTVLIQLGGPGARYAGNRGGLGGSDDLYSCECLWIIQLSDEESERYVKVDPLSQEYIAGDDLRELLPFDVNDQAFMAAAADEDLTQSEDSEADDAETRAMNRLLDSALPPSGRLH